MSYSDCHRIGSDQIDLKGRDRGKERIEFVGMKGSVRGNKKAEFVGRRE